MIDYTYIHKPGLLKTFILREFLDIAWLVGFALWYIKTSMGHLMLRSEYFVHNFILFLDIIIVIQVLLINA